MTIGSRWNAMRHALIPSPRRGLVALLAAALAAAPLRAADPQPPAAPPPADSRFALTIYSEADAGLFNPRDYFVQRQSYFNGERLPGYGVVREIRRIDLNAGENTVKFADVAAGIDPTTVTFHSLTDPSTTVLEQSFEHDLVSPDKLLEKYVDKDVILNRRGPAGEKGGGSIETIEGKLLSYDEQQFVLQTANKQLPVQIVPRGQGLTEIKLFDLQTGLITKPTLVWKVRADKAGPHDAQVTYQTDSITWRADYNVVVNADDTAADIGAWVTIANQSGAAYPDARLKLVAGDVRRLRPPGQAYAQQQSQQIFQGGASREAGFKEKPFFEYHLYTLGRTTSIDNNATKQIELFPTRTGVPVTKTFVYYGLPNDEVYSVYSSPNLDPSVGTATNKGVDIYLVIRNSEKSGLGIPLPAGRVRAYKKDAADGVEEFVGEDVIRHTPKDEQLMVRLGGAFDVVGERVQTAFNGKSEERWLTESFEIKIRNHKKEPVRVIVKENLFRWSNWEITASSDKYVKQDYRTIHIPVDVPPDGEKKVAYTVKYTW